MTEDKPKIADIMAMFSRCWGPLWECLKVGGKKHGWESFRKNNTNLFINAGSRHNTEVRKHHNSWDSDGFSHAAAVLANALMTLENIEEAKEKEEAQLELAKIGQEQGDYDPEIAVGEPQTDEDSEVVCGAAVPMSRSDWFQWAQTNYWESGIRERMRFDDPEKTYLQIMCEMYSEYLAECKDAQDGAEAH
jgi:hypothetical protein